MTRNEQFDISNIIILSFVSSDTHNLQRVFRPRGGALPYIGYIGMCIAIGYGFFSSFGLK